VIVADLAAAARLASEIPAAARALAARHWPGPLTIVVPARAGLPRGVAPDGVALRRSSCPLADALARAAGGAVTATSANRSGDPAPPLDPGRVLAALGDRIDLLLDAGPLPESAASTLVDARSAPPRLLRRGPVDLGDDVAPPRGGP
jgi:L-threonylcarbamoyladenylate synthase